jgi:hypothetical protein
VIWTKTACLPTLAARLRTSKPYLLRVFTKLFSRLHKETRHHFHATVVQELDLEQGPAALELFRDFMSPFGLMRTLIAHRFWYGIKLSIGWAVLPSPALAIAQPPSHPRAAALPLRQRDP